MDDINLKIEKEYQKILHDLNSLEKQQNQLLYEYQNQLINQKMVSIKQELFQNNSHE